MPESRYSGTAHIIAALATSALVASPSPSLAQPFAYGAAAVPQASAAGTAMYIDLANLAGIGNTAVMTRVPVKSSTGVVSYQDITVQFDVSASGAVTMSAGFPQARPSLMPPPNGFLAGNYKDTFGNVYVVTGPGILSGGRAEWTVSWVPPAGKTGTFNMSWATGPVAGSPFEAVLNLYKITGTSFNWGVIGSVIVGTATFPAPFYSGWYAGHVTGVWQVGNQLEIHNFINGPANDYAQVFLTRCTTSC